MRHYRMIVILIILASLVVNDGIAKAVSITDAESNFIGVVTHIQETNGTIIWSVDVEEIISGYAWQGSVAVGKSTDGSFECLGTYAEGIEIGDRVEVLGQIFVGGLVNVFLCGLGSEDYYIIFAQPGEPPSVVSAYLERGSLPTDGEKPGRSSLILVEATDPDGLENIDSVIVDLSPIGGATQSLHEEDCPQLTDGLYCSWIHTKGDIATGDVILPITITDQDGLEGFYDFEIKVVMLIYDIWERLQNNPLSILGQEVWITALAESEYEPSSIESASNILDFVQFLAGESLGSILLMNAVQQIIIGPLKAQMLMGTHSGELVNMAMMSGKPNFGPHFFPLGVPYFIKVLVDDSGLYYYLEPLQWGEDQPSQTNLHYTIPTGYTFYDPEVIVKPDVAGGSKVCTMAIVTERHTEWPTASYLRLELRQSEEPLMAQAEGNTALPGLGDFALVCGTKRTQNILPDESIASLVLVTTEGSGFVRYLRGSRYSVVYRSEYLRDSSLEISIESPVDIHLYDEAGRHVGAIYNGSGDVIGFDQQISKVIYAYGEGDTHEFLHLANPKSGYYQVRFRGTGTGSYTRTMVIRNRRASETFRQMENGLPITSGQIQEVILAEIPKAPVGLSVGAQSGHLKLDWDDNQEDDLAGYVVYRSAEPNGVYLQMSSEVVSTSAFTDFTSSIDQVYFYYVTAADTDRNESGHLPPISNGSFIYLPVIFQGSN